MKCNEDARATADSFGSACSEHSRGTSLDGHGTASSRDDKNRATAGANR